jgi:F0F1-type ATP synthase gamma subunit
LNRPKKSHDIDSKIVEDTIVQSDQRFIASEHGARMTAMHKATDNATDLKRVEIDLQKHVKLR